MIDVKMRIAYVYSMQGRFDDGLEIQGQCLKKQVDVLGGEHPQVAMIYYEMGMLKQMQRTKLKTDSMVDQMIKEVLLKQAIRHVERALTIQLGILGKCHGDVQKTREQLRQLYMDEAGVRLVLLPKDAQGQVHFSPLQIAECLLKKCEKNLGTDDQATLFARELVERERLARA